MPSQTEATKHISTNATSPEMLLLIAELDNKVADMTAQLQATLDANEASFKERFAVLEATVAHQEAELKASGHHVLKASDATKDRIAAAKSKKELRNALYASVDEHVSNSVLEGSVRKVIHVERRTALVSVAAWTAGVAAVAATVATKIAGKRAMQSAETVEADGEAAIQI